MKWRMLVLCGALVSGALVACDLPIDSGNSRPLGGEGGGYGGYSNPDRGYQIDDERAWEREHEHYSCADVRERLDYDREKLSAIDPSKHHKAAQWYRDDIYQAEQDWHECQREHRADDQRRARDAEADARAACAKLRNRVATDHAKLAEIDPSKHHKAAKYYEDDLRDAERQLAGCH